MQICWIPMDRLLSPENGHKFEDSDILSHRKKYLPQRKRSDLVEFRWISLLPNMDTIEVIATLSHRKIVTA